MKSGFLPIYNKVITRKKILSEKIIKDNNKIWDGHYILEFNPVSKKPSEFLISSPVKGFPTELVHWNKEYCSFKINILDNIGNNNGKKLINWIKSFYNKKNDYYNFNIYDENTIDISLFIITKDLRKVARFYMPNCTMKNPMFHFYNRNNPESSQISLTLCTRQSVTVNHFINLTN